MAQCVDPCEYDSVSIKISTASFPTPNKAGSFKEYANRALLTSYTDDSIRRLTLLELYFETNKLMMLVTMPRISMESLIGNVGGSLGVWTGLSMVSIIHALFYTAHAVKIIFDAIMRKVTSPQSVFVRPRQSCCRLRYTGGSRT